MLLQHLHPSAILEKRQGCLQKLMLTASRHVHTKRKQNGLSKEESMDSKEASDSLPEDGALLCLAMNRPQSLQKTSKKRRSRDMGMLFNKLSQRPRTWERVKSFKN